MLDRIFTKLNILEKGLDASWTRNEVLANNIANADTPDFKRSDIEFESVFQKALGDGSNSFFDAKAGTASGSGTLSGSLRDDFQAEIMDHSGSLPSGTGWTGTSGSLDDSSYMNLVQNKNISIGTGQNSVDIDFEMTEIAKNAMLYDTITNPAGKQIGRIKTVLNEGR
jgi:flagellar basal-body rod protein FlgB